jgi:hypothetical protein
MSGNGRRYADIRHGSAINVYACLRAHQPARGLQHVRGPQVIVLSEAQKHLYIIWLPVHIEKVSANLGTKGFHNALSVCDDVLQFSTSRRYPR